MPHSILSFRSGFALDRLLLVTCLCLSATTVWAETFVVDVTVDTVDVAPGDGVCSDTNGDCSLRAAVMEANALAGADTIELDAASYLLSLASCGQEAIDSQPVYDDSCGDLDIQSDITVLGVDAYLTLIDAESMRPGPETHFNSGHFDVDTNGILRLHDVLLHDGGNRGSGGSIRNVDGQIRIEDAVFFANRASFSGGAIDTRGGIARIERTLFSFNAALTASLGGGALFHSNPELPLGGASLTVIDSTFYSNDAEGGLSSPGNNDGKGGALSLGSMAVVVLNQVTLAHNSANGKGGGIYASADVHSMSLLGSTVSNNRADTDGDGTTVENGGGLWSDSTTGMVVRNSILGDNIDSHASIGVGDCGGSLNVVQNTLLEDSSCSIGTGAGNVFLQDPDLLTLSDRGGPVPTVGLGDLSPAIDAADNAHCGAADARGRDRIVGGDCDMGAFESGQEPIFQARVGADFADIDVGDGGCWTFHPTLGSFAWVCTLRAALQEASEYDGTTTIELREGTYFVNDLGGGVSDNVGEVGDLDLYGGGTAIVRGAGADRTKILQDGSDRVFDLPSGGGRLELHGVELRGGRPASLGGGNILVRGGGELLVSESLVHDGWAEEGGAIAVLSGSADVERSTITFNKASGAPGNGGGIYFEGTHLTVVNSTFYDNSANGSGGAIAVRDGTYDFDALTVVGNFADSDGNSIGQGGGLYFFDEESGAVFGSIVAANIDAGGEMPDCAGLTDSEGYNLIGVHTNCGFLSTGDLVGSPGNALLPQLRTPAFNGGTTRTFAPLEGSPVIDANLDFLDCPAVDQRGTARPVDGDASGVADCDIGAFEVGEPPLFADGFETGDTSAW